MPADVRAAADLAARIERLQRAARRRGRRRASRSRIISPTTMRWRRCSAYRRAVPAVATGARRPTRSSRVHVVCADTDAEAERLASTVDLNFVRRNKGEFLPLASPGGGAAYRLFADRPRAHPPQPRAAVRRHARRPCGRGCTPLIEATGADEIMITTMIYDHAARKRSYESAGRRVRAIAAIEYLYLSMIPRVEPEGMRFPKAGSHFSGSCASRGIFPPVACWKRQSPSHTGRLPCAARRSPC